jgi:hypothetical protein
MSQPALTGSTALRRALLALLIGGLVMIVAGLVLLFVPGVGSGLSVALLGGGLALLGADVLLGGDLKTGLEPRIFNARGEVARGRLIARCGLSDLAVSPGPLDRIASIAFGPLGKPAFEEAGGVATIRLASPRLRPNVAHWRADLAPNVLWDVDVRSSLGHVDLDLRDIRLERVTAHTSLGRVRIVCPERGYTEMNLQTTAGEIEIVLPPGVGAAIEVRTGALGSVTVNNKRLLAPDQRRYVTADVDTAAARVRIRIEAAAGDVILS